MKLDQETLSKQRFWILFGVMVPLLLICMLWLTTSVADTNQSKRDQLQRHKDELDRIAKADLKGAEYMKLLTKRATNLEEQRLKLWEQTWDMQKELVVWPKELQDTIGKLPFGDETITDNDCDKFSRQTNYKAQVDELGKMFKQPEPLQGESVRFKDGPEKVLVHVSQWKTGKAPSPEEVWLAQEDLWVQRVLLGAIQEANQFVARFQKVEKDPYGKNYPAELGPNDRFRSHFINPYWHLDLILTEKAAGFTLRGTIQNRPDSRRQLPIGRIYYEVQVNKGPGAKPVILSVEGEALAPGQEWPIKEMPLAGLVNPEGLLGVMQIFDVRDAPVRQINEIHLAYHGISPVAPHRLANKPLLPMLRGKAETTPAAAAGTPAKGAAAAPAPRKDDGPPKIDKTDNGLIRTRYTEVSKEVRRMPFGMVLLVDQAHVPEVLTALTNSRLRAQITQVGWQHYKGSLGGDGARPGAAPAGERPPAKGPVATDLPQANVVELAVYGIASIYERYPAKETAAAPPAEPAKP